MVIIYEYWITKFKQGIKLLTKENKIKTNYATDKFGASSFKGAVKSSVLSLTGLRKRMIQFGLNDLLPSIMMMTNREVNKTTLKPNALARISDDKLKLFLYKLEKDEKLRKEVVAAAPSLESKLLEFIQILKKEDQADIKEKEEIKKKKEESKKQEEIKKQEASKQKEEKEAKAKEMKEKMKQGKKEKESKDTKKSSATNQPGKGDSGKPSTPSPSVPGGPSGRGGPGAEGPSGRGGPGAEGSSSGGPGAEGSSSGGPGAEGPNDDLAENQTSDQPVSPIQTTELTGEVEKKYPEILATNVDDVFIPGEETVYSPKGSNDEALISVKRYEYTQLEQDIQRLQKLLKNEKLATNINKNTLKKELRTLLTMKDSLISEIRYIDQRQKMNNEFALNAVKQVKKQQDSNKRSLNKRSLTRPAEINEPRIPIEDSGRKRTAKKGRKKDRKNPRKEPRKKIQKDNKRRGDKRSVKKVRTSIKQLENQIKEQEKNELERNIKQLEREINRLS